MRDNYNEFPWKIISWFEDIHTTLVRAFSLAYDTFDNGYYDKRKIYKLFKFIQCNLIYYANLKPYNLNKEAGSICDSGAASIRFCQVLVDFGITNPNSKNHSEKNELFSDSESWLTVYSSIQKSINLL